MATEQFKQATEELLENYLDFRKELEEKKATSISLSFKEYVSLYIEYLKADVEPEYADDDYEYSDEDESKEDYN